MLLRKEDTSIRITCQQYVCNDYNISEDIRELYFYYNSKQKTKSYKCKHCGSLEVTIHSKVKTSLRDFPCYINTKQFIKVSYHKYRCKSCGRIMTEDIPFKEANFKITTRLSNWVKILFSYHLPISSICEITGLHWNTVRSISSLVMGNILELRMQELKSKGYKPRYLAVDEFAIHKGHKYATCVMDLGTGEIIWVGIGKSINCFKKFFLEFDMEYLNEVQAVAMDMNASYNKLVKEYMPYADIVYDRYHMQAQFNRDVLGVIRLEAARKHREKAKEINKVLKKDIEDVLRNELIAKYKLECNLYKVTKEARKAILAKSLSLKKEELDKLNKILEDHQEIAICYAMKEELNSIFDIKNQEEARNRWKDWFEAAKKSGIKPLVKFARLKEKRIEGLIAHAIHPISTGKLEGVNNKIKVAKRIGYGYRNHDFFFTLVRYISLSSIFRLNHLNL